MQVSHISKLEYNGRNQAELSAIAEKRGYKSNEWITFLQAKKEGFKLVNASKQGVSIFNGYRRKWVKTEKGKIEEKTIPVWSFVFNLDLCEKL